ncbi:MAG: helix-turn-helix transcriptional regulator [Spirochaetaceae bacterium]|nr:helix-turn-helix transcriptional regulator [Spirochaetaceae bacterium]MBR4011200.1 helix-turn-helix transcriptional regulator [Spirochaetaceae bacterium]
MDNRFDDFRMNIKYYRTKNGLSQAQLAEATSCSNGMIGLIEAGKAKPSFDMIISLSEALNVHPADLFLRNTSQTQIHIRKSLEEKIIQDIKQILQENLN